MVFFPVAIALAALFVFGQLFWHVGLIAFIVYVVAVPVVVALALAFCPDS